MHEIERGVDLLERHRVGDQVVDVDLAFHVPVDDLRHVRASPRPSESGAFPDPSGDELERAGGDFLAGFGDADHDALAPTAMAAFKGLAHHIGVAGGVEREIRAAAREIDDRLHHLVVPDLARIDEIRHAEFAGDLDLGRD